MLKNKKKYNSELNNGIQILRMILAYLIVQLHCYEFRKTKNKYLIFFYLAKHFYVPTFYIISYYFTFKIIILINIKKIKLRFQRILIPYFIWPFIFYLLNIIKYYFYGGKKYSLKDLYIQFLTGKRIYVVFWFQCNLILSFILLNIIVIFFKRNNYLFIIQFVGISAYFYYNYHYYNHLFNSYIYEIRSLIQDFSKVIFLSSLGISLASFYNIKELLKHRKKVIFFSLFNIYLIHDFSKLIEEYYYLKLIIIGLGSISIFIIFLLIPFNNIKSGMIIYIITQITKYTGGIYYLHYKIRDYLSPLIQIINQRSLIGCLLNYIICYFICLFGSKLFKNSKLKYLFN